MFGNFIAIRLTVQYQLRTYISRVLFKSMDQLVNIFYKFSLSLFIFLSLSYDDPNSNNFFSQFLFQQHDMSTMPSGLLAQQHPSHLLARSKFPGSRSVN